MSRGEKTSGTARLLLRGCFLSASLLLALAVLTVAPRLPAQSPPPAAGQATEFQTAQPRIIEIKIDGPIEPVMAEYVIAGLDAGAAQKAALVLITIDTPGGLSTSMEAIIQRILDSPVPVAVYVTPAGARAASAGFFILLSADVAAMGPATHTGSASPLLAIGGVPLQVDDTLKQKILNDATAFLRSYAGKRGRNVELAETGVTEGKAWTETEALENKLIDRVAGSPEELLAQLDGQAIRRFDGSTTTLELSNATRIPFELTFRQRFLSRIVQPDMFFILLIVGVLGLYAEFTHPGLIVPGVVGGISLVLALFAMHILPVAPAGIVLILLALALFILEANYASHGVLAIGGIIAMLLGALMLIRSPLTAAGVSLGVAAGVTVPFAILTILLMRLVLRSRGWKPAMGPEQLSGATALVADALVAGGPDGTFQGMVHLEGALWRAIAHQEIPAGERVRVMRIEGLTLYVEPDKARGL